MNKKLLIWTIAMFIIPILVDAFSQENITFYDDFNDNSINGSKWTVEDTGWVETSSRLQSTFVQTIEMWSNRTNFNFSRTQGFIFDIEFDPTQYLHVGLANWSVGEPPEEPTLNKYEYGVLAQFQKALDVICNGTGITIVPANTLTKLQQLRIVINESHGGWILVRDFDATIWRNVTHCAGRTTESYSILMTTHETAGHYLDNANVTNISDITPPEMDLINLSSEGGEGQIILDENQNNAGFIDHRLGGPTNLPDNDLFFDTINMSENIGLYHFNGNSTLDTSGKGNDLTAVGDADVTADGKIQEGYELDGNGDFLTGGTQPYAFERDQSFSASFWFKPDVVDSFQILMSRIEQSGDQRGWRVTLDDDEDITVRIQNDDGPSNKLAFSTTSLITVDVWTHFAFTYNGTSKVDGLRLYINGIEETNDEVVDTLTGTIVSAAPIFSIGSRNGQTSQNFNGIIDEVGIWNRTLNPSEIQRMYLQGEGRIFAKTNDTTVTIRATTNEAATCAGGNNNLDLNYTDWIAYNPASEASTTGGTQHIWTLTGDNATGIGAFNFSIGCKDALNNENRTSTSGKFLINVTDDVSPTVNPDVPADNVFFQLDINSTNILFNFSASDNFDVNFICNGFVDGIQIYTNATYLNGTEGKFNDTPAQTIGTHKWNVSCIDSFNNLNSSQRDFIFKQEEVLNLNLSGNNDTQKYEFRTKANISANCQTPLGETCQVCIDLDAPGFGYNFSCGFNTTHFIFNITTLRIVNFSHGPSTHTLTDSGLVNVTSDNKTQMVSVKFNVTSSGTATNLNISYLGRTKKFFGDFKTIYLEQDKFIHNRERKNGVNLTYTTRGSNFIFVNLTDIDNPINLSFYLSGFDLDINNELTYTEYFNSSDFKEFNQSLRFHSDAPIGKLDEFATDNNRWNSSGGNFINFCSILYSNGNRFMDCGISGAGVDINTFPKDPAADMRNSSYVSMLFEYDIGCGAGPTGSSSTALTDFRITDGTSTVSLKLYQVSCGQDQGFGDEDVVNITLINKRTTNDEIWEVFINGSSEGNKDIGALDFSKRIYPTIRNFKTVFNIGGVTSNLRLFEVDWGGGWLNRSTNNGTYKSEGNVTQCIEQTTDDLSKVTLTAIDYVPNGTGIFYSVSNEGGASPTFERVTIGLTHTFLTTGKDLCWRATLNSSENITSPVVRRVTLFVVSSTTNNVTVDQGADDIIEFTFTGVLNESNSPQIINLTPRANQLNIIKISTGTPGMIQINIFRMNASINPVILTESVFEDCSNCSINFTFSGDDLIVNDLRWDLLGSHNYTATARSGTLEKKSILQIFYSFFNISLPTGIDWYDVFPSSKDSKNVTPFGQTSIIAIWNASNQAYDEKIDIYVKTNESISCLNVTYANTSKRVVSIFNESFVWINGTAIQLNNQNIVNGSIGMKVFTLRRGIFITHIF